MKGKEKYSVRRITALLLALLLAVNLIPGSILESSAEGEGTEYTIEAAFLFKDGNIGSKVTDINDVTFVVQDGEGAEVQLTQEENRATFTGRPGVYGYELKAQAYKESIKGEFEVEIPESPDASQTIHTEVAVETNFDEVPDQVTSVQISGKVTDKDGIPLEGIQVQGSYDNNKDGQPAFSAVTGEDGRYTGSVDINRTVVIEATDTDGKYEQPKETTINVGTEDVTVDLPMEQVSHTLQIAGVNSDLLGITVNGDEIKENTSIEVGYGDSVVLELTQKQTRYNVTYCKNGGEAETVAFDKSKASLELEGITEDTTIQFGYETTLEITDVKKDPKEGWTNDKATVSGSVADEEDKDASNVSNCKVQLIDKNDTANLEEVKPEGNKFKFEITCEDGKILEKQYLLKVIDNGTELEKTYKSENGEWIEVKIDKVQPILSEVTITEENSDTTREETAEEIWYTGKVKIEAKASDEGSGMKGVSYTYTAEGEGKTNLTEKGQETGESIYEGSYETPEGKQGSSTLTFTAEDNAGNTKELDKEISYDNQAPEEPEVEVNDHYMGENGEITVTANFSDGGNGSGIKGYYYEIREHRAKKTGPTGEIIKAKDGEAEFKIKAGDLEEKNQFYDCYVWSEDKAGNLSKPSCIENIMVDTKAPEIRYKIGENETLFQRLGALFGHNTLTVEVTADDGEGAGFKESGMIFPEGLKYQLQGDEETKRVEQVKETTIEDGKAIAVYEIKVAEENAILAPLEITAQDRLGNGKDISVRATDENSNITDIEGDILVMLESKAPELKLTDNYKEIEEPWKYPDKVTEPGQLIEEGISKEKLWVNAKQTIRINGEASDEDSRLYSITAEDTEELIGTDALNVKTELNQVLGINGNDAAFDDCAKSAEFSYSMSGSTGVGERKFTAEVQDNAGNVTQESVTYYFDGAGPKFESIYFESADANGNTTVPVVKTGYGFFFTEDTVLTAKVKDYADEASTLQGAGVEKVTYKLVPAKDSEYKEETGTLEQQGNSDKYSFTVKAGFKGEIQLTAVDHVSNNTPANTDKVVLESEENHGKKTTAEVKLNGTPYKDADNYPLYAGEIKAEITAMNTFSGVKQVTYVRKDGTNGTAYQSTFEADIENGGGTLSEDLQILKLDLNDENSNDENLVTKIGGTDSISYGNSEVSGITLNMDMTCNAGHKNTVALQPVSYDALAPRVSVTWDNHDVRNEKYYKAGRTATIVVEERNFDESKCEFITTGPSPVISGWSHNGDTHTATVAFSADGDYTFTFRTTDRAGHTTAYDRTDEFTIDQTAPVISVSYDNNDVKNGYYYKEARTANITITEHNFRASEVTASMTANDNGAGISVPAVNGWNSSGDRNTASIGFHYDGEFTFGMTYEDLAGNPAVPYGEDHFVVDLTDPELEIYDIVDKSANNDVVAPGVRYSDTNVNSEGVAISLDGANRGAYSLDGNKSVTANGVDLKLNDFPREKDVDDLYTMKAHVEDLSGRVAEQEIMFSVNRFGSVYVLDDATKRLVEDNEGYTNQEQKVGIREINVDLLETKDVSVSRDGDLSKLKDGRDYQVQASGTDATWKEYYYQLDKKNFEEEGSYSVTVFSTDKADNSQDNKNNKRQEECTVEFVVDKTAPSTVVSGIEADGRYREPEREVHVDAKDNIRLDKVITEIDGEVTEYDAKELAKNDGSIDFKVASANKWQKIKVYSVDKAGNTDEQEMNAMKVIVTSNVWVQFTHNIPLMIGVLLALAAMGAACFWFFVIRKKDKEEDAA